MSEPIYTASDAKNIMVSSYRDGYLAALLAVQKACEAPAGTRETISDKQPGPEVFGAHWDDGERGLRCPYGAPGDALWVRETWCQGADDGRQVPLRMATLYRADGEQVTLSDGDGFTAVNKDGSEKSPWRPSIHMPRWASRITLRITDVRVERLQGISEDDARAEGCQARPFPGPWWQGYRDLGDGGLLHQQAVGETAPDWMIEPKRMPPTPWLDRSAIDDFRSIWMGIHAPGAWEANPWVWVVAFERVKP